VDVSGREYWMGGELLFGYIYNLYSSRNYVTVRKLKIYKWVVYKIDMRDVRNSHDTASGISKKKKKKRIGGSRQVQAFRIKVSLNIIECV